MHTVIRTYSGDGAKQLFDLLEARQSEVEGLMRPIQGFESYLLARTDEGGTTVTVCRDKAGCDESIERAKEWIASNAGNLGANPPQVSEGQVITYLQAEAPAPA